MVAQLFIVVSAFVAVFAAPSADKYPAGLNPNLCPNYPHCDNALLAAHSQQQAGFTATYHTPASTFGYTGYAGAHVPGVFAGYVGHPTGTYGHVSGAYGHPTGSYGHSAASYAAPGYPAGVDPASCPNYPYCTTNPTATAYHVAPLPGFASRQYPDGVNPSTCPNYPFCH